MLIKQDRPIERRIFESIEGLEQLDADLGVGVRLLHTLKHGGLDRDALGKITEN